MDENTKKVLVYAAVAAAVYFIFLRPKEDTSSFEFFQGQDGAPQPHHHHHYHESIPDAAGTQDIYAPAFPS